jgi:hypothetical protein
MEHRTQPAEPEPGGSVLPLPLTGVSSIKAKILAGQAPLASVDSPSSTHKYQVVLREQARPLQLIRSCG